MTSDFLPIDVHTHIIPPGWEDFAARFGVADWPSLRRHDNCQATIMLGEREFRRVTDQCYAPLRRIADMEGEQIGKQLVSPVPVMLCYWGPAEATAAFARMQNDFIADVVARYPQRFLGAGTVAMQSPKYAIAELERLKQLGFHAIEIGTHVNGRDLDDPRVVEILAAAEALELAVFVHPQGPSIGEERMKTLHLPYLVGYPADTSLAIARLIVGGVLERLPKLRVCFAHGGGSAPALLGRLDRGYAVMPEVGKFVTRPPSAYARTLYFDTLTHDVQTLELLCRKFGSHRLMLGSDYPFVMGVEHPLQQLVGIDLSADDRDNILFKTAREFLGLD